MGDDAQLYPVFLRLAGRPVVLVGAGKVAAAKLEALLAAGAHVTVVAPAIHPDIAKANVTLVRREFIPIDLDGAWFVVAAAPGAVNRQVSEAAEERRIFVNAVDDVGAASAYLGGVVRRDGVTLAISTNGAAPALAGLLREGLDSVLPDDIGQWRQTAEALRPHWRRERLPMDARRPMLLNALNALYAEKGGHI